MKHTTNPGLFEKQVNVVLVGAGGNGSQMLTGLAQIHFSLLKLGHPHGLHVTVCDPDTVSEPNVGRQLFSTADVGINKAAVLVHRVNMFYGLNWQCRPCEYPNGSSLTEDIVISCVDTKKARREIHHYLAFRQCAYWLDMGNNMRDGQVILGEPKGKRVVISSQKMRLPTVTELFPVILDETVPEENSLPSCSHEEALDRQDLFICRAVATPALDLLWQLFRFGGINNHGSFINLEHGMVTPLRIDQQAWELMRGPVAAGNAALAA